MTTKESTTRLESEFSAAIMAAGIAATVLGVFIVLNEVSPDVNKILVWSAPVGALSGKTGFEVIVFVLSWVIMHFVFKGRLVNFNTMLIVGGILLAIGTLLTFPPIFELFAGG